MLCVSEILAYIFQELTRQGEQLKRAERGLDDINRELNTSKRYITSLKSWFGPVKNYFSSSTNEGTTRREDRNTSQSNQGSSEQPITNATILSSQSTSGNQSQDFALFTDSQMGDWSSAMKENERKCNQNLGWVDHLFLDKVQLWVS